VGHKEADAGVEVDVAADGDALPLGTIRSALWMSQPTRFSRKS
jgi:hypothetical protein